MDYNPLKPLYMNLNINLVSSNRDNFDFTGADGKLRKGKTPGYTKVDLALSYEIKKNLSLSGRIDNLLDRKYEEIKGYPSPGITLFMGLKASF